MHGLVNRALQCFLRDTYGPEFWDQLICDLNLDFHSFEAMLIYDDQITYDVLGSAVAKLNKSKDEVLEDLGTYLVSHANVEALRRLLRFGGITFEEFLWSLDDLPDRARLAVPDLKLPAMALYSEEDGRFCLRCSDQFPGFGHVMVGILRAMADDYGALVFIDHGGTEIREELVNITLLEAAFSEGRSFELARQME